MPLPPRVTVADIETQHHRRRVVGASAETDSSTGPLVALLVALLAIGFFVLPALK
jgi:hypothetical protein